jgi:hypothetical protein
MPFSTKLFSFPWWSNVQVTQHQQAKTAINNSPNELRSPKNRCRIASEIYYNALGIKNETTIFALQQQHLNASGVVCIVSFFLPFYLAIFGGYNKGAMRSMTLMSRRVHRVRRV